MLAGIDASWLAIPGSIVALLGLYTWRTTGRAVSGAGLAGSSKSAWRGQSARSVAATAADSAVALSLQVEQLERKDEKNTETIRLLQEDVHRLERLVTQAKWGEQLLELVGDMATKVDTYHEQVLTAIAARSA